MIKFFFFLILGVKWDKLAMHFKHKSKMKKITIYKMYKLKSDVFFFLILKREL